MPNRANRILRAAKAFAAVLLILCFLITVPACGSARLSAPTGVNINQLDLSLNWNGVPEAAYYTIRIRGDMDDEILSSNNYYNLDRLSEGTYTISVRAEAGANSGYSSSRWSETIEFVRPHESGMTFTLTDNNTAFEVSGIGTASGDIVIPDTYRGLPVTSIGANAFMSTTASTSSVTSVTFGSNVKRIGDYAFANCSKLTQLTLPEGLESIGAYAFQSCRGITGTITIPDSVTEMGDRAFQFCRELTGVVVGSGLTAISSHAFDNCTALTSVNISPNVTVIGDGAFLQCTSLSEIYTGDGVTEIGDQAFSGCTALRDVTFGEMTQTIGSQAFYGCTALNGTALPDSVTEIGSGAFYGCTALKTFEPGKNIGKIGSDAFYASGLWEKDGDNNIYVGNWFVGTDFDTEQYTVVAPRAGTVGIADGAYRGLTFGSTLILPDSVKYIGESAFADTVFAAGIAIGSGAEVIYDGAFEKSQVTQIILGALDINAADRQGESSLRDIGNEAFRGCAQLTRVTIPDSVVRIGSNAFRESGLWTESSAAIYAGDWLVGYNDSGESAYVTIAQNTAGIADYTFYQKSSVAQVQLPESVKHIGMGAFSGCINLFAVNLPEGITEIPDYAFYRCTYLQLPELPSTLTRIGRSAFYMCALGNQIDDTDTDDILEIPDSVTEIGDYAFFKCGYTYEDPDATGETVDRLKNGGIDSVIIGDNVTYFGEYAFYGMASLKQVTIGANVEKIGQKTFYNCEELATVIFGKSLKSIGARAFYGCSSLRTAILPSTVREIGDYAFYKCEAMTEADLGSAESIGVSAFLGCKSLTGVTLPSELKSIGSQAFRNCSSLTSITLGQNVASIGAHAFYGCSQLSVYAAADEPPADWNSRWNSSYRAVVWGSGLSEEGWLTGFILDGNITDLSATTKLSAPVRDGYVFGGFATEMNGEAVYDLDDIENIPEGTVLYAVWSAK